MKRKKFLALALAGVMTAATLTACAPLEDLYDWFFGSGSASRGNGVNLVELNDKDYNGLKKQIMDRLGLNDGDVTTPDRSRKALEEVVGKLDAAMLDTDNKLNTAGQKALNDVAKSQLQWNNGMCIDVMKWSPTRAAATEAVPENQNSRTLYWAQYTNRGNGSTFGEGGTDVESSKPTYTSGLWYYSTVKSNISYRVPGSKVDLFAGTFTKNGETYLAVAALWELGW